MSRGARRPEVMVVGDWDADGVVASALVYYAQRNAHKFPFRGEANVNIAPSGPRGIGKRLSGGCWDYLVVLDIPVTEEVIEALSAYRARCKNSTIIYVDHHDSTRGSSKKLEALGVLVVAGREPTSMLVKRMLENMGVKLHPRLQGFVDAVGVLEGARGGVERSQVDVVAGISKAMNRARDEEVWRRYVLWVSEVLPQPQPPPIPGAGVGGEEVEESDKEIRNAAMELAMSASTIGMVVFVDARRKWKRPGASALAAQIQRIVKRPVALLIEREDGARVLVIRSSKGEAKALMEELNSMGIVEDVGGHENVATGRLAEETTVKRLVEALHRASIAVIVKRGRKV
ncbi:MAG: phosphoesterase [Desulfurococcales archaeon]|nr:phosphoesterase [Desulfurococcales archaeon]